VPENGEIDDDSRLVSLSPPQYLRARARRETHDAAVSSRRVPSFFTGGTPQLIDDPANRRHSINKSFPAIIANPPREKGDLQQASPTCGRPGKGRIYMALTFSNNILSEQHKM
jgi:hypothetical protein